MGKSSINGPFSMAMLKLLNNQMVYWHLIVPKPKSQQTINKVED